MSRTKDTDFALAQLRHLYQQMVTGYITGTNVEQVALGLLGPSIEKLERAQLRIAEFERVLKYLVNDGWLDDVHFDGCPEDDTCTCPIPADINRVLAE